MGWKRTTQRVAWLLIGLAGILGLGTPALAQPNGSLESSTRTDTNPDAETDAISVEEVKPSVTYWVDDDGRLMPLINIPLERIQDLLYGRRQAAADRQPPTFQIEQLNVQGTTNETFVALEARLNFTILPLKAGRTEPQWTAIPLRFHDAALVAPPEYEGNGELQVVFHPEHGYEGWLRHTQAGKHQLRLKLSVPLQQTADGRQLSFYTPLANQSQLELSVPGREITASLENVRNQSSVPTDDDRTLIQADGLRNQVVVNWQPGNGVAKQRPTHLHVIGDMRVLIDGPGVIRSTVTLDLQSYGRDIEEFTVKLPPHTQLVSSDEAGFTVREISNSSQAPADARRQVQVTLEKPAPTTRFLFTTQTAESATAANSLNVANFEVHGALRQSGRVSLLTSEEWLVYWNLGPSVRRVPNLESVESSQDRQLLASFQYFRQPCRLDVEVKPQGKYARVQPTYQMHISADQITLEVELSYRLRGSRASFLDVDLRGWTLDEVGPIGAFENDDFSNAADDLLKLRLTQALAGEFTVNLTMSRPLSGSRGTVRVPLPWPVADTVSSGTLQVTTDDPVTLNFDISQMQGVVFDRPGNPSDEAAVATSVTSGQPIALRVLADRTVGDIVFTYEVRPQEIRIEVDTDVELTMESALVTQKFGYRVRYQPLLRVTLELRRIMLDRLTNPRFRNSVDLRIAGESVGTRWYEDAVDNINDSRDFVPVTIELPQPRLGNIVVELEFPWTLTRPGATTYSSLPLAVPRDGVTLSNIATLRPVGPLRVEPAKDNNWTRDDELAKDDSLQAIGLTRPNQPEVVRLRVAQLQDDINDVAPLSGTVVNQAWHQSWLSDTERLDRAVFKITTGAESIQLALPPGIDRTVTFVDGVLTNAVRTDSENDILSVDLPRQIGGQHTIEIALYFAARPPPGQMAFDLPVIQEAIGPQRWFWRLLLPPREHLFSTDRQLTPDNRWVRQGWFWKRQDAESARNPASSWVGGTQQPPLPKGLNRYLFSSFGRVEQCRVRTVSRKTLVYSASSVALALAIAVVYLPVLRRPALLVSMAVTLAGAAWLAPDMAILLAQASIIGIVLGIMSLVLRVMTRRRPRTVDLRPRATTSDGSSRITHPEIEGPTEPTSTIPATAAPISDSKA